MKKFILIAALALIMFANVSAQSATFTVTPSNVVTQNIEEDDYVDVTIDFNNTTSSNIVFKWTQGTNTLPTGWNITMCDYPSCFPYIPNSGTMDPIGPGNYGFIKLTVNPGPGNIGSGSVSFDVWDEANPSFRETITMNVNAVVGIEDQLLEGSVSLYPNPTTDRLFLSHEFGTLEAGMLTVLNVNGAEVIKTAVNPVATQEINIANLPAGMYMVRYQTEKASMTEKVLKMN
jgi:hypothetical protein